MDAKFWQIWGLVVAISMLTATLVLAQNEAPSESASESSDATKADDSSPPPSNPNAGLEDLDEATQVRIDADSVADLEKIIRLCESGLKRGLDEDNTTFAKQLLVATLYEHAIRFCQPILARQMPDAQRTKLRAIALADLEKLLRHDDQMIEAYLWIARLEVLPGGNRARALEAMEKIIPMLKDEPEKLSHALVQRAQLMEEPEKRLADLNEAIRISPENLEALRHRGLAYLGEGKHEQAIADFSKVLAKEDGDLASRHAVGEALVQLEKYDEALEHLNRAIEMNPQSLGSYLLRARTFVSSGDLKRALEDLDTSIELDPRSLTAILFRAEVHERMEQIDLAIKDVDQVLRMFPNLPQAILMRCGLAARMQNFEEAIAYIRKLVSADPDNVDLRVQMAAFYAADERPRKAIETYDSILEKYPESWTARRGRANALLSIGKHGEAIEEFVAALEKSPDDDNMLNNLAWVLATSPQDDLRDGARSLELALRACEFTEYKQAHILSTLAAAHAESGDFEMAIEWSSKAIELESGEQRQQLSKELDYYKQNKPWRERQEIKEKEDPDKPQDEDLEIE